MAGAKDEALLDKYATPEMKAAIEAEKVRTTSGGRGNSDEDAFLDNIGKITRAGTDADKQNKMMHDYVSAQGTNDWDSIDRLIEDIDTEKFARMADKLNNRLYMRPSIGTLSGGGGINAVQGNIYQGPNVANEDTKQQDLRRGAESARRTWNSGIAQEGTEYNQNMALLNTLRQKVNEMFNARQMTEAILGEDSKSRREMYSVLMGLPVDQRNIIQQLIGGVFDEVAELVDSGNGVGTDN